MSTEKATDEHSGALDCYLALPTWLLTRAIGPRLPVSHPWHKKRFQLRDWADKRTYLCRHFDIVFWLCGINLVVLTVTILAR